MIFLPIIQRELRVALRKRSTFWLRIATPVAGLVVASACFLLGTAIQGSAEAGRIAFQSLTWLGLGGLLTAGLFLTSDCLSEEKREGTLGFLFLTDLRGYDVVFGKLLATSLRSFYIVLAVLPILSLTLLTGGVTGMKFFKTSLALLNALLCSLAAGLFVSSISREAQKAMSGTLLLVLLICIGGPLADAALSQALRPSLPPIFSLVSPSYAFQLAGTFGPTPFWTALFASGMLACALFGLACFFVPRTWHEKAKGRTGRLYWGYDWKYGNSSSRLALRRKLIGKNPVLWLASRERWQPTAVWIIALLALAGLLAIKLLPFLPQELWTVWNYLGGLIRIALYVGVASQANRFLVDARRNGLTELLLASPLTEKQIVHGQLLALLRQFGGPVLLLLFLEMAGSLMAQNGLSALARFSGSGLSLPKMVVTSLMALLTMVTTAANLVTLSWFGMWMGMTSQNTNLATLKTVCFAQLIPSMIISFSSTILVAMIVFPRMMSSGQAAGSGVLSWFPLIIGISTAGLSLAKDVAFIVWSKNKLYTSFRAQAARGIGGPRLDVPPVIPTPGIPTALNT